MAIDPLIKSMSHQQRERWAWVSVGVLGLLAIAWTTNVYWLRPTKHSDKATPLNYHTSDTVGALRTSTHALPTR